MKIINTGSSKFIKASEVQIPEVFNRRFKTNTEELDNVFGGEGFLPGMSFTFAAPAGSGKTTLLLQTLELLEGTKKKTAYISGEETIQQLAFTCKRLNVKNVSVANMTVIEDIFDAVEVNKFDIIILDSLPALTSRNKYRGRQLEEYMSNYITTKAKKLEVVVGIILHMTKQNTFKGSTLLPHSVDANFLMFKSKDNPVIREIEATKNRFGSCSFTSFLMTEHGFDFRKIETEESIDTNKPVKKGKIAQYREMVLEIIKENGSADLPTITKALECSIKAQSTLRDLSLQGIIRKEGRGQSARWVKAQ
jgi:predicted ATP-dependent serine protease